MLFINFPEGSQKFNDNADGSIIGVNYSDKTGLLSIEAHFEGYSYFLSECETSACCEIDLNNTKLSLTSESIHSGHEFSSHSDDNPDLQVDSAKISFSTVDYGIIKIIADGEVSLYEGEDEEKFNYTNLKFPFKLETYLKIEPGDWLMDLAHGYEISTLELYGKNEEKIDKVLFNLHGMADKNNTKATELITLFDRRDDRSIHCYGRNDRLIIECTFPQRGIYNSFVLAVKNSTDESKVSFKPDNINAEITVMEDEFFSVEEAGNILSYFLINRTIDTDKYNLKEKSYLFKIA